MATNQKGMPSQEPSPPNPVSQKTSPGAQARNDQGASKSLFEPPAINLANKNEEVLLFVNVQEFRPWQLLKANSFSHSSGTKEHKLLSHHLA
jgi:hypothetical protein